MCNSTGKCTNSMDICTLCTSICPCNIPHIICTYLLRGKVQDPIYHCYEVTRCTQYCPKRPQHLDMLDLHIQYVRTVHVLLISRSRYVCTYVVHNMQKTIYSVTCLIYRRIIGQTVYYATIFWHEFISMGKVYVYCANRQIHHPPCYFCSISTFSTR